MNNEIKALKGLYTIRDSKACVIGPIFTARSDVEATRSFSDIITGSKESLITRHPEDFVLLVLGSVDEETGVITALSSPSVICCGSDFKE